MKQSISVIVPVYNLERELPRCLDSLLAQTHGELEIIPVDDGSRDGSRRLLEDYARRDPRIRPLFQENAGVTAARLAGVAAARGEWIGFVDGDDMVEPQMFSRLLENARAFQADISHCGYRMVFPDGRVNFFHNSGKLCRMDTHQGLSALLRGELVEPGLWNKLFRRELFAELKMDPAIAINEDLLMNFQLFSRAASSVFEDVCPYHYIVREASASRARLNDHRIFDPIRVREQILADCPGALQAEARRTLANTCVYTYCSLVTEGDDSLTDAKRQVRQKLRQNRQGISALAGKTWLLAALILHAPGFFGWVYPVYARYFQKSPYR